MYQYMQNPNVYGDYPQMAPRNMMPQTQQPQMVIPTLNGKFINDIKEVTANDVPMTGQVSVFVKNDLSEIYTKNWGADGTIATVTYKKLPSAPEPKLATPEMLDEINDRIDDVEAKISDRFEKIERAIKNRARKEEDLE